MLRHPTFRQGVWVTLCSLFLLLFISCNSEVAESPLTTEVDNVVKDILVSKTVDGTKVVADGSAVTGTLYFHAAGADVTEAQFYLDDEARSGAPFQTLENGSGLKPLDSATLEDGMHTVTAVISRSGGQSKTATAAFLVDNGGKLTGQLLLSRSKDRTGATLLEGANVSGDAYIFVVPGKEISQMAFYLDDPERTGEPERIERFIYFDFAATDPQGRAYAFDSSSLSAGEHTITAVTTGTAGAETTASATFTAGGVAQGFPVFLRGDATEKTAELSLQKPSDADEAELTMTVFDADHPDEGELYINGQGPLSLFGQRTPDKDQVDRTVRLTTPASWWRSGTNELRFVRLRTTGYIIRAAQVSFSSASGPDPDPEPPAPGVERWSDPATWGGALPQAGATVDIPAGKSVLLDVNPPALAGLRVEGELRFVEQDISLTSGWIMVQGALHIGSAAKPFQHQATLTLTGDDPNKKTPVSSGIGNKVLGVVGGTLELHGQKRLSWTRLGATADKGATQLRLAQTPDWQAGDRIVVASTDFDYEQAEERVLTSVSGGTVSFDEPLVYMHFGQTQSFGGKTLDERAEVGLLSHNIVIQGDEGSSAEGFGAHLIIREGSTAHLSSVELRNMGQARNDARGFDGQGRYPIHWHLAGDSARGSYLKDSSIHHSFNRCATIHGSNGVTLERNVAYETTGHCYFIEDGVEVDNVLRNNLGLSTRRPEDAQRLLISDNEFPGPATYWITHPDNVIEGNIAAGSEGSGFWIALPEHPTGPSATNSVWNRRIPLNSFKDNVAHSSARDGLHVDRGPTGSLDGATFTTVYRPVSNPSDPDSEPVPAVFEAFTAYKNRGQGVWLRGRDHVLLNAMLADNAVGVTFASDETVLKNGVLVGESANLGTPRDYEVRNGRTGLDGRSLPRPWDTDFHIRGFDYYDGKVGAEDSFFTRFEPNSQRAASALSVFHFTAFHMDTENYAKNLSFASDTKRLYLPPRPAPENPREGSEDGYRVSVFNDLDGSVTGMSGRQVVVDNPFLVTGTCQERADWGAWVCNNDYATLQVGTNVNRDSIAIKRDDGVSHTMYGVRHSPADRFQTSVLTDRGYSLSVAGGTPSEFDVVLQNAVGNALTVSVPYPSVPTVKRYSRTLSPASSLSALNSLDEMGYYYSAGTLHLRFVADYEYERLNVYR